MACFLGEPHLGEDVEQTMVHRLAFGAEEMAEAQIVGEASVRDHLDPVGEYVYGGWRALQPIAVHHGVYPGFAERVIFAANKSMNFSHCMVA